GRAIVAKRRWRPPSAPRVGAIPVRHAGTYDRHSFGTKRLQTGADFDGRLDRKREVGRSPTQGWGLDHGARCGGRAARTTPGRDPETADALPILGHVDGRDAGRRLAWSTAIFSLATGLSRILGLVREIVAAYYFGARGRINAFTVAFQVPNLVRALLADAAISSA